MSMMPEILPNTPPEAAARLPMAETFFRGALCSHSLAHAYILKGKHYGAMYNLALTIAQILNCKNRPGATDTTQQALLSLPDSPAATTEESTDRLSSLACGQCTDCRWIAQNAHPAVLTISRLTYQVGDKGEDLSPDDLAKLAKKASQPTQIKAEQIERLLRQLGVSSEHTRVVIFTDVEELPASMPSDATAPFEWRNIEANADKSFHIRPLERRLFNAASANRFLKTLEEPPPGTVFFFIAETEEQLMETIVSRCQVIPCLSDGPASPALSLSPEAGAFLESLTARMSPARDAYVNLGEFEQFFITDGGLSHGQALDVLQAFLRQRFVNRLLDPHGFAAYQQAQQAINTAQRMLASRTNEAQSLLNLFMALAVPLEQLRIQ